MTTVLSVLPLMVCTFWSVVIFLDWITTPTKQRLWLLTFMVTAMFLYLGHAAFFFHFTEIIPITDTLYCSCNLLVFPLFLRYLKGLCVPQYLHDPQQQRHDWPLLFIPSLLITLLVGTFYLLMSDEESRGFIGIYLYHNQFTALTGYAFWQAVFHHGGKLIFALQVVAVAVCGWKNLRSYHRLVDDTYADTDDKKMRKMQVILTLLITGAILGFVSNLIGRWRFDGHPLLLWMPSLFFSILLFMIGYAGSRQQFSVCDLEQDTDEMEKPSVQEDSPQPNSSLAVKLEQLMNGEQLYLRHDLKIGEVATLLNTNRTYIQRAIGELSNQSFTQYINRKRIEHATRLMREHPEYNMETISTQSGYTHLGTFYRNYKIFTGKTPAKGLTD